MFFMKAFHGIRILHGHGSRLYTASCIGCLPESCPRIYIYIHIYIYVHVYIPRNQPFHVIVRHQGPMLDLTMPARRRRRLHVSLDS